jgi:hypothetical protein
MWRSIYLSSLLSFLSLMFLIGYALADGPAINFNETRYDFGSVKKGEKIEHEFEFRNGGNEVLRIEKLIPA